MATFRPSARVRMVLRLEEYQDTSALISRLDSPFDPAIPVLAGAAKSATSSANAELVKVQAQMTELAAQRDELSQSAYQAQMAALKRKRDALQRAAESTTQVSQPETLAGTPPDELTVVLEMLPISVSVERNGTRAADTCTISLRYQDVPIDPRIVRKAYVEVIIGTVPPEMYEGGMQGQKRAPDDFLQSVVSRAQGDGILAAQTRFVGFVDEWAVQYDGDGDTLELTCRDPSGLLIDKELPRGVTIDLEQPITQGISDVLEKSKALEGVAVIYGKPGENLGVGPVPGKSISPKKKARKGKVSKRAKQGDQRMSVWDHITDVVIQTGLVPLFYGTELHVMSPRTLYQDKTAPKRVVYGKQLSNLAFTRKLAGETTPTIEVRTYDTTIGRTRWARYPTAAGFLSSGVFGVSDPPKPARANNTGVSGANPDDKIYVYTVAGVTDPSALAVIARATFEQLGRQEISGSFSTADIDSEGESNDAGGLLNLVAGDAIELLMLAPSGTAGTGQDIDEGASSVQRLQALSRATRAQYMHTLGWNRGVAEKIAALQDATGFQTTFRVQTVQIEWSGDDGLEITVDFINFITVRETGAAVSNIEPKEAPSPEVERLAGDRQSESALAARDASSARRTLTKKRDEGKITQQAYERGIDSLLSNERERVLNLEAQ